MIACYYDLHVSPASYDVVAFLLAAERYRIERGEENIAIHILPGPKGGFRDDRFWPFSIEERQGMIDRVVVPMCGMLPSASEVVVHRTERPTRRECPPRSMGYMTGVYGLRVQIEMMRQGVRPLRASPPVLHDPRLVTITLREAEHWPERNSNVLAWAAAARYIARQGFDVRVIRDTLRADESFPGLNVFPGPSRDMLTRALFYQAAVCNLFVNNGPAWFALALDAPVVMLKPTVEKLMRTCTADYFRDCGIEPGGQIPNSPPYQRIVWAEDTAENIVEAFDDFMGERRAAA